MYSSTKQRIKRLRLESRRHCNHTRRDLRKVGNKRRALRKNQAQMISSAHKGVWRAGAGTVYHLMRTRPPSLQRSSMLLCLGGVSCCLHTHQLRSGVEWMQHRTGDAASHWQCGVSPRLVSVPEQSSTMI
mmetsp:Transcript_32625/g.81218  ORF Transcript_32625/g.81218 Transcript_32625/m.81218 type:complete len:130 (-) Transcript_32625:114-503(-)